jgi:hypothetical protein
MYDLHQSIESTPESDSNESGIIGSGSQDKHEVDKDEDEDEDGDKD